jgi:uncharacterized protein YndB with AHSA1/START domain
MQTDHRSEREQDREIVTTRVIDGPRRLVFEAWTESRHLARWFGPRGFTTTTYRFDFRPGGVWHFDLVGPNGTVYPNWVEWQAIVPPEQIAYRQGGHENDPDSFMTMVSFADCAGGTAITLRVLLNSKAQRDYLAEHHGAVEGGLETLERLDEYVHELEAA